MSESVTMHGYVLRGGEEIIDLNGKPWTFLFAARPGLRGQPEGEVFVRRGGTSSTKPSLSFRPTFFPGLEWDDQTLAAALLGAVKRPVGAP